LEQVAAISNPPLSQSIRTWRPWRI
jgi:hypothetical protein